MRFRVFRDMPLIVTRPNGQAELKKVILYIDTQCQTLGVLYTEGPLKGWAIDLPLARIPAFEGVTGELMDKLPEVY